MKVQLAPELNRRGHHPDSSGKVVAKYHQTSSVAPGSATEFSLSTRVFGLIQSLGARNTQASCNLALYLEDSYLARLTFFNQ